MVSEEDGSQRKAESHKKQVAGIAVVLEQCSHLAVQGIDFHEKWETAQQMLRTLLAALHRAKQDHKT